MPTAVLIPLSIAGLFVGSFLTTVIRRVPRDEPISRRSRCPDCGTPLAPRDTIPVLAWLMLRGSCRHCATAIPARYPVVEMATATGFVAVAAWMGRDLALPAMLCVVAAAIALTAIDIELRRLPTPIIRASLVAVFVLLFGAAALDDQWSSLLRASTASLILGSLYVGLALAAPSSMGWGDVRLAALLGLAMGWFGWAELAVGGFAAFALGATWGTAAVAFGSGGRKTTMPFGPFMILGAGIGVVSGPDLAHLYWLVSV